MKAVCYYGKEDMRVETRARSARSSTRATRSSRSPRPRSAAPTCTSTTATSRRCRRATSSATSSWARSSRSGATTRGCKVGDRVVVPFTIACGHCFFCKEAAVVALRQLESERVDGREAVRLLRLGPVRLLAHVRRLSRRAGRVRARAVRRRRPAQGARLAHRRAGAVPLRHLPDRLHGRRELRHQARRHGRRLGLRAGRPVRDQERVSARRRARDRDRPLSRAAGAGRARRAAPRSLELRGGRRARGAARDDRRPGAGRLHRRGRPRGARHDARRLVRPREDVAVPGDRSAARAAAGDQLPAARAARSRSPASTAAGSTSSRSARRSPRG